MGAAERPDRSLRTVSADGKNTDDWSGCARSLGCAECNADHHRARKQRTATRTVDTRPAADRGLGHVVTRILLEGRGPRNDQMKLARVAAALGSVGLATSIAVAEATWTTQVRFAQTPSGPALEGNTLSVSATGVYTFVVQMGIFSLSGLEPGQANHGLAQWSGAATATGLIQAETLGLTPVTARFRPFDFGPASAGGTLVRPSGIGSVDCVRNFGAGASAPWMWDTQADAPGPQPQHPVDWLAGPFGDHGADSFTNVWRFTVTVDHLNGPPIAVHLHGYAGPVAAWWDAGAYPPESEKQPGLALFGILPPGPPIRGVSSTLTIVRVPAPGFLALAPLVAISRGRRRGGPSVGLLG